jgi:uncharacterized membrane protein
MTALLHPMLVHFPIALLLAGSLVYLYALWRRSDDGVWERTALLMLVLGWLGGLAAVITGGAAFRLVPDSHPAHTPGAMHAASSFGTLLLYAAGLVLHWRSEDRGTLRRLVPLFLILGMLALTLTGYLGGELVYTWTLGVAG